MRVRVAPARQLKSAGVVYFANDEMGRYWRTKAEEEGPFPGRLELATDRLSFIGSPSAGIFGSEEWSLNELSPTAFRAGAKIDGGELAQKTKRFLPPHVPGDSRPAAGETRDRIGGRVPILVPFDRSAKEWMPEVLPDFREKIAGGANPTNWRFMLSLRPDGSVAQCVSLSGDDEESVGPMLSWLRSVRFKKGEGERWLGLRVEFLNRTTDGS